ncbi:hypothetical protein [Aeromicrobium wangtongii]|uniref:Peptidase propeptide and YPEB domain-containing protein n=1 Tax=Aeromicrobium wangtongii TaxID=2969247 RepID=A0ABY5MAI8_9ACTN|nr:hypothetical protein [Aeromicrobium wangtongii]MCD9197643.1 hypothetical protein [Aeromicrobium wangtongii]UUP15128.1 hypothetical protein NQV15_07415 [Aeromicrobium wangtongii]
MTTDHSGDFDARRIGWWQRRSAARQIRRATGITALDRDLRLQSARVAQTRGELNALTRGLSPAPQALASAVPARPTIQTDATRAPAVPAPPAQQPARPRSGSIARTVALGAVVLVLACGGSLVSCVSSLVDSARDSSGGSKSSPETLPESRRDWTQMVRDIDDAVGADQVYWLAARGSSASIMVRGDDGVLQQYYYRDGDVEARTGEIGGLDATTFDLTAIGPHVVPEAVAAARNRSGVSSTANVVVDILDHGEGPRIRVSFPGGTVGTYQLVVDAAGNRISENAAN